MKENKKNSVGSETILGVDYGKTNIGVALGRNGLVSPLKVVQGKNSSSALYEINRVVIENKVGMFVVGLPLTPDGKETKESLNIRRFAKILKITTKRPVVFQNEFGTSKVALEEAIESGVSQKGRRSNDHLAAALILKQYYNENTP